MSLCPSCQFLIADDDAGCEFCGRTVAVQYPGTPPPFDAEAMMAASAAPDTGTALVHVPAGPPAVVERNGSTFVPPPGTAPNPSLGAAAEVFPAPYPRPWSTQTNGLFDAPAVAADPTPSGATVHTGPSNLVIVLCLLVGCSLLTLGIVFFVFLG